MILLVILLGVLCCGLTGLLVHRQRSTTTALDALASQMLETDDSQTGNSQTSDSGISDTGITEYSSPASASVSTQLATLRRLIQHRLGDTQDLRSAHQQLKGALDFLSEGVVLSNNHGKILYKNTAASSFVDSRHEETLVDAALEEMIKSALLGEATERNLRLYGPPDQTLLLKSVSLTNGAVVLITDISHQLRLEIIRKDLSTNLGHELRTPVGALSVLADAMAVEDDPEVLVSLAHGIAKESSRLTHIVEDLVELNIFEETKESQMTKVVLQEVIQRATHRIDGAAQQGATKLEVDMPAQPVEVWGNFFQLTSAVYNLLDNAIKYSDSGIRVLLSCGARGETAKISVSDSGIGIPHHDHERVFERFFRVDRSRSKASGSGLGLAVVRQVVTQHGGEVKLESHEGTGSTFTISLPTQNSHVSAIYDPLF